MENNYNYAERFLSEAIKNEKFNLTVESLELGSIRSMLNELTGESCINLRRLLQKTKENIDDIKLKNIMLLNEIYRHANSYMAKSIRSLLDYPEKNEQILNMLEEELDFDTYSKLVHYAELWSEEFEKLKKSLPINLPNICKDDVKLLKDGYQTFTALKIVLSNREKKQTKKLTGIDIEDPELREMFGL